MGRETLGTPFRQLRYLPYLPPPHTRSVGNATKRRAPRGDPLAEFVPQPDRSLMGIRSYQLDDLSVPIFASGASGYPRATCTFSPSYTPRWVPEGCFPTPGARGMAGHHACHTGRVSHFPYSPDPRK